MLDIPLPSSSFHVTWKTGLPEGVFQCVLTGIRIALSNKRHRHSKVSPFKHQVLCRQTGVPSIHSEGEGQVLTVTQNLVTQELAWNRIINPYD